MRTVSLSDDTLFDTRKHGPLSLEAPGWRLAYNRSNQNPGRRLA
jgi:hypothetical protein